MKCLVLEKPYHFRMGERPIPIPGVGESLVRVRKVGICGTDLHAYDGKQPFFTYPRVLGHELAVELVELGSDHSQLENGDLCIVMPYRDCGKCIACRNGKTNCCSQLQLFGIHIDGGMQEYLTIPTNKLLKADNLSLEQMSLVENQSIGAHAVRRAELKVNEFILVIGAGAIGLGIIQSAKIQKAKILVMDINEKKLDFCKKIIGVEGTIDARQKNPIDCLEVLTHGDLPTAVFDSTGSTQSMMNAFRFVSQGGRLILVGLVQGDIKFNDPDFHRRELTVMSSRNATRADFEYVIDNMEKGEILTEPLISHRVSFDDVMQVYGNWLKPESGLIKAVVEMY
jgi:2-desacetyl-2-hydroxyethyl bacteriochlorophyllide A dehydrogenase